MVEDDHADPTTHSMMALPGSYTGSPIPRFFDVAIARCCCTCHLTFGYRLSMTSMTGDVAQLTCSIKVANHISS